MDNKILNTVTFKLPQGTIVFISGVPGVGKTTISYELLRAFDEFRIVEETDLIREVLRGYNEYMKTMLGDKILSQMEIAPHNKFFRYNDAKIQCRNMKKSIEKIIHRQKRKGITTIINGVHIVPEILDGLYENENVIYLNLYINNQASLFSRWEERDPAKYNTKNLSVAFQTNIMLFRSIQKLSKESVHTFYNIDVTHLSIERTRTEVLRCLANKFQNPQA